VLRNGGFVVIPREITLDGYKMFFENGRMNSAYGVTMFITVVGTALNIVLTLLLAYPLSKRELPGSRAVMLYVLFSMLFTGGTIPKYLIVKDLGLIDSIWSLILPIAITPYNVILMRTFFRALPEDLFEAALIDGANQAQIMIRVTLPLSKAVLATIGLFYAVGHWNSWFDAMLYINTSTKLPMQNILRNIINSVSDLEALGSEQFELMDVKPASTSLRCAVIVITATPIIVVYPFVQKYFVKGVMIGSVKG
jgi:putative aldouronate transport system permease protein